MKRGASARLQKYMRNEINKARLEWPFAAFKRGTQWRPMLNVMMVFGEEGFSAARTAFTIHPRGTGLVSGGYGSGVSN